MPSFFTVIEVVQSLLRELLNIWLPYSRLGQIDKNIKKLIVLLKQMDKRLISLKLPFPSQLEAKELIDLFQVINISPIYKKIIHIKDYYTKLKFDRLLDATTVSIDLIINHQLTLHAWKRVSESKG